jgi:tetratricopeptide (TPR) repeat protein
MRRWWRVLAAALALAACSDYDSRYGKVRNDLSSEIESGTLSGEQLAMAYLKRGYTLELDGQRDRALADYDKAIATAPRLILAYQTRAPLLTKLGRYDQAMDDASQVIALSPANDDSGYLLRGDALAAKHDYAGAVDAYSEALTRDPKNWLGYGARGEALAQLGQDDRALADLDRAVALDPGTMGKTTTRECYRFQAQTTPNCTTHEVGISTEFLMSRVYLDRGMILFKRGDYARAADDLKRSSFAADKETMLYQALADFGAGKCDDGRYSLRLYQRSHDVDTETLVAAHRDFIAKTPCADSVLKQ